MDSDVFRSIGLVGFLVVVGFYAEVCLGQVTPGSLVKGPYFLSLRSSNPDSCQGKRFYKYQAFITAAEAAAGFGTTGADAVRKREIAAFLAHAMHETGEFCYVRERNATSDFCDRSYPQWPCTPGKRYFGRGPLQLTWNYNYGPAGKQLRFEQSRNCGSGCTDII